jgi:heme exporter protein A
MTLQATRLACIRGERQLFDGIDIEIGPGEALWVQGRNGSGKTSLLRLLCGLAEPAHGEVRWRGRNIRRLREDFHRELLYIGHASGIKDDLTPCENLLIGARLSGRRSRREHAECALERMGLARVAHVSARRLSQGQRRRVALAALHLEPAPRLLVLDEPFTALDAAATSQLGATLEQHSADGSVVVYTTHQPLALRARRLHQLALGRSC